MRRADHDWYIEERWCNDLIVDAERPAAPLAHEGRQAAGGVGVMGEQLPDHLKDFPFTPIYRAAGVRV